MLTAIAARATLAAAATAGAGAVVDRRAAARERAAEAAFPPEGTILDVPLDGRTVPVHAVVRGRGPDVVLIHGASGNLRDWTFRFAARLADRYRVIALDRPGLGYTGRVHPRYDAALTTEAETPEEQARLLQAAAQALGAERPLVVGHSFGGTIALAWAVYLPGTLRALALVSAPSNRWEGGLGPLYAVNSSALGGAGVVPLLTAFAPEARLRAAVRAVFAPDPVPEGYADHVGAPLTLRRRSLRANARQVNGLKPHVIAMEPRYPDLALPIEAVHGSLDTAVPPHIHAHPFDAAAPTSRLTMLDGVGHMPHHVVPDAVEAAIDRAQARC